MIYHDDKYTFDASLIQWDLRERRNFTSIKYENGKLNVDGELYSSDLEDGKNLYAYVKGELMMSQGTLIAAYSEWDLSKNFHVMTFVCPTPRTVRAYRMFVPDYIYLSDFCDIFNDNYSSGDYKYPGEIIRKMKTHMDFLTL
jgi:hypothetical protein